MALFPGTGTTFSASNLRPWKLGTVKTSQWYWEKNSLKIIEPPLKQKETISRHSHSPIFQGQAVSLTVIDHTPTLALGSNMSSTRTYALETRNIVLLLSSLFSLITIVITIFMSDVRDAFWRLPTNMRGFKSAIPSRETGYFPHLWNIYILADLRSVLLLHGMTYELVAGKKNTFIKTCQNTIALDHEGW